SLIDRDQYFLQVLRYIVLNPVKAGLVSEPASWQWSSYRATAGYCAIPSFLDLGEGWRAFDSDVDVVRRQFIEFVGAVAQEEPPTVPVVYGSAAFSAEVAAASLPFRTDREIVRRERLAARPTLEQLFTENRDGASENTLMREAFERHGYTLREI